MCIKNIRINVKFLLLLQINKLLLLLKILLINFIYE